MVDNDNMEIKKAHHRRVAEQVKRRLPDNFIDFLMMNESKDEMISLLSKGSTSSQSKKNVIVGYPFAAPFGLMEMINYYSNELYNNYHQNQINTKNTIFVKRICDLANAIGIIMRWNYSRDTTQSGVLNAVNAAINIVNKNGGGGNICEELQKSDILNRCREHHKDASTQHRSYSLPLVVLKKQEKEKKDKYELNNNHYKKQGYYNNYSPPPRYNNNINNKSQNNYNSSGLKIKYKGKIPEKYLEGEQVRIGCCYDYNLNICKHTNCKWEHVCLKCGKRRCVITKH